MRLFALFLCCCEAYGQLSGIGSFNNPTLVNSQTYNVQSYLAKADAKNFTNGACTSGSTTFTDSTDSPFVAADTGKTIELGGCGLGSNNNGQGIASVASITNSAGNAQIHFTQQTGSTTPASGNQIYAYSTSGGLTAGTYFMGTVTNVSGSGYLSTWTAILYTNYTLTTPVSYSATGTGQINWGPVNLTATITYVSATQVTLSTVAGTTVASAVSFWYGTNNAQFVANAYAALPAAGGVVYFPSGQYLIDATETAAGATTFTTTNCAINGQANAHLAGDGMGKSIIVRASELGPVYCGAGSYQEISDVTIRYAYTGIENRAEYVSNAILFQVPGSGAVPIISHNRARRIEISTSNNSWVLIGDGCNDCQVSDSIGHDKGGFLMTCGSASGGSVADVTRSGFVNVWAFNNDDAMISIDSYGSNTCNVRDGYVDGAHIYNAGASGIEITGGINTVLRNVDVDTAALACIRIITNSGYSSLNGVSVTGFTGGGCGAGTVGPGRFGPPGGVAVYPAGGSQPITNVLLSDIHILASGMSGNPTYGPYVCIGNGTLTAAISNVTLSEIHGSGGISAYVASSGHQNTWCSREAGVEVEAGSGTISDFTLGTAYINSPYEDGVYVSSGVTGNVQIGQVNVDIPNTSATSSVYALNVQGGTQASIASPTVTGTVTLAGNTACPTCAPRSYTVADTASSGTTYTGCPADQGFYVVAGTTITFTPATSSSGGTTTINLCGLGAHNILRKDGVNTLTTHEWLASTPYGLVWNGSNWLNTSYNFPRLLSLTTAISGDTLSACLAIGSAAYFATSYTIPSGEIGAGSVIHVRDAWTQSVTSGVGGIYGLLKLGSTIVVENGGAAAAQTNYGFMIDATITGTAAPGASVTLNMTAGGFANPSLISSSIGGIATNGTLVLAVGPAVASTSGQTCAYANNMLMVERLN